MINIKDVANYFLSRVDEEAGDGISNLKLQKLCYYAQGFYLALYGEKLFNDSIEAWHHGPVVPNLYHHYKAYGSNNLEVDKDFDYKKIDNDIRELLDDIYCEYGQYSAWRLRDMTHQEEPWLESKRKERNEIDINTMKEFFKTRIIQ